LYYFRFILRFCVVVWPLPFQSFFWGRRFARATLLLLVCGSSHSFVCGLGFFSLGFFHSRYSFRFPGAPNDRTLTPSYPCGVKVDFFSFFLIYSVFNTWGWVPPLLHADDKGLFSSVFRNDFFAPFSPFYGLPF